MRTLATVLVAVAVTPGCLDDRALVESVSGNSCRVLHTMTGTPSWTEDTLRRCDSDDECMVTYSYCCAFDGELAVSVVYERTITAERQERCAPRSCYVGGRLSRIPTAQCIDGLCELCERDD